MKTLTARATPLLLAVLLAGSVTRADDRNLGQFWYANCGAYVVSPLWLHWKIDGDKHSKRLDRSLVHGRYTCVDLARYDVPAGAEVWLSYQIVAGDRESCRKDDHRYFYKPGSNMVQFLRSEGTTLNGNRCRVNPNDYANPEGDSCASEGGAAGWWTSMAC